MSLTDQGVALVPVTIGTQTLPAGSTAVQRFEARVAAQGGTVPERSSGRVGPPLHVHSLGAVSENGGVADTRASEAKAAPTPKQLEKQNSVADFDAEMQRKGLQRTPAEGAPAGEVDQQAIEKLNAAYRALPPAEREAKRAEYREELKEFFDGRREGEKRADFQARQAKGTPAAAPSNAAWSKPDDDLKGGRTLTESGKKMQADLLAEYKALPAADKTPATSRDYQAAILKTYADKYGMVNARYFEPKYLSGYTLPAGDYAPNVLHDLARARVIGLNQSQVNAVIEAERTERMKAAFK